MESYISILEIIRKRKSKRNFIDRDLDNGLIEKINSLLQKYITGPFGNKVTFSLIEKKHAMENHKVKLGTYGFISGAGYFIAGQVKDSKFANEDYGYLLEKIILNLTELGLGTCWLGGTFKRSDFFAILKADCDMIIPAITPVGFSTENKSAKESIIRWGAGADNRKKSEELFFIDTSAESISKEVASRYDQPLEMVRLAPSASNKQPWRILIGSEALHFYMKRTPGYKKDSGSVDLQRIDMGIAMSHFELACGELNLRGVWNIFDQGAEYSEFGEYLISWKIERFKGGI